MSFTLYDYQQKIIDDAREEYRKGNRAVLVQLVMRGGKTISSAFMVKNAVARGSRCLWLVHRREIIFQASKTFWECEIEHGLIMGGGMTDISLPVQIGSVQTIARRLDKIGKFDLIIMDETHHIGSQQYQDVFNKFPKAKILGLTGTPWRLDGIGLGRWYQSMVQGPSAKLLLERNRLAPYRLFAPPPPDTTGVGTVAGDFKRNDLASVMRKPKIMGDSVEHFKKLIPNSRAISFECSIENSKAMAELFQSAGVPAEHVDGDTDDDVRDAAIQRFISGETRVLSNVDLFGEGVDIPVCDSVIMRRPTKSLGLYLQQAFRPLTYFPDKTATILDHAGNSVDIDHGGMGHGLPCDDREWTLSDREKRKKGKSTTIRNNRCPKCYRSHPPAPQCPSCGFVYPVNAREIEQIDGELIEVDKDAERRQRNIEQGRAKDFQSLIDVGRKRGMRNAPAWARHVMAARMAKEAKKESTRDGY